VFADNGSSGEAIITVLLLRRMRLTTKRLSLYVLYYFTSISEVSC